MTDHPPSDFDPLAPEPALFSEAFYDDGKRDAAEPELREWLSRYATRLQQQDQPEQMRRDTMNAANPRYVLRNYLAQQAIDQATQGDISGVTELLDVMRRPYADQPGREAYSAKRPDWARSRAGCSMLSCSS